jgi:hypothetical protein
LRRQQKEWNWKNFISASNRERVNGCCQIGKVEMRGPRSYLEPGLPGSRELAVNPASRTLSPSTFVAFNSNTSFDTDTQLGAPILPCIPLFQALTKQWFSKFEPQAGSTSLSGYPG